MPSTLPTFASTFWACWSGMIAMAAPASESTSPNFATPTTV